MRVLFSLSPLFSVLRRTAATIPAEIAIASEVVLDEEYRIVYAVCIIRRAMNESLDYNSAV